MVVYGCEIFAKQTTLLFFAIIVLNVITVSVFYYGSSVQDNSIPIMKHHNTYCSFTNHTCMLEAFQMLSQKYKQWIIDQLFNNYESWENLPDKFDKMNQNPIYRRFNINQVKNKGGIDIILIVSTAPARKDRRMAIRETWWQECQSSTRVSIACLFLTDAKASNVVLQQKVLEESNKYKDMRFQNLMGGFDFGRRFLYHMVWAMMNYNFKYFMRMDDDYFLCMRKFLKQVIMPPPPLYHWGWVHCLQDLVRPEESIILLSRDLVERYLGQDPYKMLCNRWGDQLLGVWKNELNLSELYYHHDVRLHHDPPAKQLLMFRTKRNICKKYIGVHGSYPVEMRTLWRNRGNYNNKPHVTLAQFSTKCEFPNVMNWRNFYEVFYAEPKLCISNPDWGGVHGSKYIGRQGTRR